MHIFISLVSSIYMSMPLTVHSECVFLRVFFAQRGGGAALCVYETLIFHSTVKFNASLSLAAE